MFIVFSFGLLYSYLHDVVPIQIFCVILSLFSLNCEGARSLSFQCSVKPSLSGCSLAALNSNYAGSVSLRGRKSQLCSFPFPYLGTSLSFDTHNSVFLSCLPGQAARWELTDPDIPGTGTAGSCEALCGAPPWGGARRGPGSCAVA